MKLSSLVVLLATALLLLGCAAHQHAADTSGHGHGASEPPEGFTPTEAGSYVARLTPAGEGFRTGDNEAVLELRTPTGAPVTGATIETIPWMSLHGHGINARPAATETGAGSYRITGIALPMAGLWELHLTLTADAGQDQLTIGPFSTAPPPTSGVNYLKATSPAGFNVTLGVARERAVAVPEVSVDLQGRVVKHFKLTVEEVQQELYPGRTVLGWGFNGQIPGPELRVNEGDLVRITLTNQVRDSHHTVHVHGVRKSVTNDGVPFLGQVPTEYEMSHTYEFIAAPSGTSWYHCHVDSAHHVDMGMYGPFIVEPAQPDLEIDREFVWVLDEWPADHGADETTSGGHDHGGQSDSAPAKRDWYPETYKPYAPDYDTFLINGYAFPYTTPLEVKTGEKVKIRVINAGYQSHFMHIHAHKFLVTHRDGRPLPAPVEMDTVQVGPGQRADLILMANNPGIWPFHCHRLNHIANDRTYPGGMLTFLRYTDWVPEGVEPTETEEDFFEELEK